MPSTIQARFRVSSHSRNLLESLDIIQQHVSPDRYEAIGYNGRQLYHFDGYRLSPISLKQSIEWCAKMAELSGDLDGGNWGESAKTKWLRQIAESL
jgi:hypothetical protein